MTIEENVGVVAAFVQERPEDAVLKRIEHLYRAELDRVIAKVDQLLPRYRGCVSQNVYRHDKAQLLRVKKSLQTDSLDVWGLEASLEYLLRTKQQFINVLENSKNNVSNRRFQLECRATGKVKAYKQMTASQTYTLNVSLAAEDSSCRWAAIPAFLPGSSAAYVTSHAAAQAEPDVPNSETETEQHVYH